VGGSLFVKNFKTRLFEVPKLPTLPPVISFPGLLNSMKRGDMTQYDNTTCKSRYCTLAVVTRSLANSDCENDMNLCTSTELSGEGVLPMCIDDAVSLKCMIWVPSKINSRREATILYVVVIVLWLLIIAISLVFVEPSIFLWIFTGVALFVSFLSIVAESDYSHWMSNSLVDKNYASYQSCVAYCNSKLYSDSVVDSKGIVMNMCGDGSNMNNPYAIWPANFNPYSNPQDRCYFAGSFTTSYCYRCLTVSNDWKKTRDAASYVKLQSYFVIGICFIFLLAEMMTAHISKGYRYPTYESIFPYVFPFVALGTLVFYVVCFVYSCIYVNPLVQNYGEINLVKDILDFQGGGIPIIDICGGYIAVDFVSGVFFFMYGLKLAGDMFEIRQRDLVSGRG
jgi:hypothetical protein